MNFENFEKLTCKTAKQKGHGDYVRLHKGSNRLTLSSSLVEASQLQPKDRVDLYYHDGIFALKKCSVGCLILNKSRSADTLHLTSLGMKLEIAVHTNFEGNFAAWCDDGIIYFTDKEDKFNER